MIYYENKYNKSLGTVPNERTRIKVGSETKTHEQKSVERPELSYGTSNN